MGLDHQTFTGRARLDFLRVLAATGNASGAARAVGMSYSTVSKHRASDEVFAAQWADAMAQFHGDFEEAAARRAMHGVREPLINKGEFVRWPDDHPEAGQIVFVTRYADSLVPILMKAHDPERHRDRSDVRVKGSHVVGQMADDVLAAKLNGLMDDLKARGAGEQPDGVLAVPFVEVPSPEPEPTPEDLL